MFITISYNTIAVPVILTSILILLFTLFSSPLNKNFEIGKTTKTSYGIFGACNENGQCTNFEYPLKFSNLINDKSNWLFSNNTRSVISYLFILSPLAIFFSIALLILTIISHFRASKILIISLTTNLILFIVTGIFTLSCFLVYYPHIGWVSWSIIGVMGTSIISFILLFLSLNIFNKSKVNDGNNEDINNTKKNYRFSDENFPTLNKDFINLKSKDSSNNNKNFVTKPASFDNKNVDININPHSIHTHEGIISNDLNTPNHKISSKETNTNDVNKNNQPLNFQNNQESKTNYSDLTSNPNGTSPSSNNYIRYPNYINDIQNKYISNNVARSVIESSDPPSNQMKFNTKNQTRPLVNHYYTSTDKNIPDYKKMNYFSPNDQFVKENSIYTDNINQLPKNQVINTNLTHDNFNGIHSMSHDFNGNINAYTHNQYVGYQKIRSGSFHDNNNHEYINSKSFHLPNNLNLTKDNVIKDFGMNNLNSNCDINNQLNFSTYPEQQNFTVNQNIYPDNDFNSDIILNSNIQMKNYDQNTQNINSKVFIPSNQTFYSPINQTLNYPNVNIPMNYQIDNKKINQPMNYQMNNKNIHQHMNYQMNNKNIHQPMNYQMNNKNFHQPMNYQMDNKNYHHPMIYQIDNKKFQPSINHSMKNKNNHQPMKYPMDIKNIHSPLNQSMDNKNGQTTINQPNYNKNIYHPVNFLTDNQKSQEFLSNYDDNKNSQQFLNHPFNNKKF